MKMKMKTHKAAAKRVKATATGKIVRGQAGRGHLNSKKSSSRKRRLEGYIEVNSGNALKMDHQFPYLQYLR